MARKWRHAAELRRCLQDNGLANHAQAGYVVAHPKMKIALRILVFALLFAALNLFGLLFGGFVSAMQASSGIADQVAAKQAATVAAREWDFHYWPPTAAIITLVSALIAFRPRRLTFLMGGTLAVGIFFFARFSIATYRTQHDLPPTPLIHPTPQSF